MIFQVINTGSEGNSYVLSSQGSERNCLGEKLIIEAGLPIREIKAAVKFDFTKVVGCLVTHEHLDHSKSAADLCRMGVNVYSGSGTFKALGIESHRAKPVKDRSITRIGNFLVMPFKINHDAAEPYGYFINHPECGNILFLTDTKYSNYKFKNLNHVIIEANYDSDILMQKTKMKFLRDRIINSHMNLENCIGFLKANDISKVENIVLIHLSDSNSHEARFIKQVQQATGKMVYAADKDLSIIL